MIYIIPAPRRHFEPVVDAPKPFEFRSELFRQQQQEWKSRPARPKLPCPLLPPFVADVAQDPVVRVTDFFAWPEEPYPFCLTRHSHLLEGFEDEIDAMPPCFQEFPFPPHPCTGCQVHESLGAIATKFMDSHKGISLAEKIELCEQFVNQFVSKIVHSFSDEPPALGKPLFACLEIALRAHLFNQLVKEEQSNFISFFNAQGKFPSDLKDHEDALEMFVTKNGFFISPDPFFHTLAPIHLFQPLIESFASKVCSDSLEAILGKWKSGQGSRTSQFIEDVLKEHLNHAVVSQQVQRFKGQFNKTGVISKSDFNLIDSPCVKKQILAETFGLCQQNDFSFGWLYTQIKAEKTAQLELPEPSRYFPSFSTTRSRETCLRLDEKLITLALAEQEWKACCLAPPQSLETLKLVKPASERATLLQLYTLLPDKQLFYKCVYEEAVAAGVQIASWDRQFAEYNWNKENMISISMRAAKRCLHPNL